MNRLLRAAPLWGLLLALAVSCGSAADPYEQDLPPGEYFQRAVEASESGNYRLAVKYYDAFRQKYPDDRVGNIWATYEIGLLYHKMGSDDKALELFDQVLDAYADSESAEAAPLPQAPRILAEKIKGKIEAEVPLTAAE